MKPTALDPDLRSLDLNLLRVFDALRIEGSVSGAARQLGITQPGASRALARLRDAFGDPLFITTSNGLLLTPYAKQIADHVRGALELLSAGMVRTEFEPLRSERRFSLAMVDRSEALLLPPLLRRLETEAPRIAIELVARPADLAAALAGGLDLSVDLAALDGPGLHARRLLRDDHVTVARVGNPRFDPTRDALAPPAVLAIRPHSLVATVLLVVHTDWITTLPRLLAEQLARRAVLAIVPGPVEPGGFELIVHWHQRVHTDDGHRWFRGLVREVAAQLAAAAMPASHGVHDCRVVVG